MIDWKKKPSVAKITGKEEFLKKREVARAKKVLSSFEVQEFWVSSENKRALQEAIEENSLFASKRLIIVYDANKIKPYAWLERYLEDLIEDKVVILVETDKGRSLKWFKDLDCAAEESFSKMKPWDLPKWMIKDAERNGFSLSEGLASAIQDNVGRDLYKLNNELQKMYLYASPSTNITPEVAQKVLFSGQGFTVFDVFEDWCFGRTEQALKRLANLYEHQRSDPTMKVLGTGLNHIEKLIRMRSLIDQGTTYDQQKKQMGGSPYILKTKTRPQAQNFNIQDLLDIYDAFCKAERRYKTGKEGYDLIQQIFITYRRDT